MARPWIVAEPGPVPGLGGTGSGEEAVWKALADPTRRAILDLLRAGPLPSGRLAERFAMSRFGVRKHLRVLQQAGLVLVEERGRERWNHLNPVPIRALYHRWIRPFEVLAADHLLNIKRRAEGSGKRRDMSTEASDLTVTEILTEVQIRAPREKVWATLVGDATPWWHADYYTNAKHRGFHIEPELGGRMFEDWGSGQGLVWGTVIGLESGASLQIVGDSTKEWGGPSRNFQTYRLEDDGDGTRLCLETVLFGRVTEATAKSLDEGWRFLIEDCLKRYCETGSIEGDATPPECRADGSIPGDAR